MTEQEVWRVAFDELVRENHDIRAQLAEVTRELDEQLVVAIKALDQLAIAVEALGWYAEHMGHMNRARDALAKIR